MKNNVLMGLAGFAALIDGVANHVSDKPINNMGILLFLVVLVHFADKASEHFKIKLAVQKKQLGEKV